MAARNDAKGSGMKVEMFKLANRLKSKLGMRIPGDDPGFLDPKAIAEADKLIAALCAAGPETIAAQLEKLSSLWLAMREMPESPERAKISQQIFTVAHEIKDIGSMCGYELIAYFAESLRDYIGETKLSIEAQRVIIQAHMDAIQLINRRGITSDEIPEAEELKKMVRIAIAKYS